MIFAAYSFYVVSFITSLFNPFYGLVALMVSVLIRFQDRFPEISAIKPFSLLFFGLIIGCIINKDKLSSIRWKQDHLLLWMLLVSMIGLLLMEPRDLIYETWEFISSLAFYYFTTRILKTSQQFMILFFAMSCCIVFMGYEAIIDVAKYPETSIFIDVRNGRWQGLGYYQNANEFGQLMITTLPFLLAFLLMKKNVLIKIMALIFIGILVFVVGKTGSRTVMLLLGIMFVLTFVLRGKGNIIRKTLKGGVFGMTLLIGLSFVPGPIQERLQTVLNAGSDKSFQGRTRAWGHGFDMLSWYPITGVGKGQWNEYHGLMPHNSYVQIMAELGPAGIFLFLWIIRRSFQDLKPFFLEDENKNQKKEEPSQKVSLHPIFGTEITSFPIHTPSTEKFNEIKKNSLPLKLIDQQTKTIVIAATIVSLSWFIYIFLGNQGYAVWTYFYIGLIAAVRNFYPQ
jgi:hypothetical protein